MKVKIANALKTKYANFGLSQKALDGVAAILEKTVTEESAIDAAISEASVADLLKVYQSESDALRNAKAIAEKALKDYKEAHPETTPAPTPAPGSNEEVLALLKSMKDEQDALKAKLAAEESKTRRESMLKEVKEKMISGGSNNEFILGLALKDATIGDTDTVDTLAAKYKEIYDATYKQAYGDGVTPPRGTKTTEGYKPGDYSKQISALAQEGLVPKQQ